jgi:predicted DNA-binding protein
MKNAMITVKVTEEQLQKFNAYAKAQDRPLAQIVREALTARINRAEKTMVEPPAGNPLEITFK